MATYSITINERTKSGKALLAFLMQLDIVELNAVNVKKTGLDKTLEALKELDNGGGTYCKDYKDYLKKINS